VAIHTMLNNLEQVVEIIDANVEASEEIEGFGFVVKNFKEMTMMMRMKYDK